MQTNETAAAICEKTKMLAAALLGPNGYAIAGAMPVCMISAHLALNPSATPQEKLPPSHPRSLRY